MLLYIITNTCLIILMLVSKTVCMLPPTETSSYSEEKLG